MKKFVLAAVVACAALATGCGKTTPAEEATVAEETDLPADAPADDTDPAMAAPAEPSTDTPSYSPPED